MTPAPSDPVPGGRSAGGRHGAQRSPWLVPVASLRRQPGGRKAVSITAPVDELFVSSARVPDGAEVGFEGAVEALAGGVMVVGRVRAPWEGTCRRCLGPAAGWVDVEVRELASEEPDPELGYPLTPDWLDLEPVVHDAVILELPLAPLCADDCLGLCPECGVNRNVEACTCESPADPRWAALAGLAEDTDTPTTDTDEPGRRTG